MFPPFPQEKAAKILEKVIFSLEKGEISLVQVSRPSEERKNQCVMLGVLVCEDENGNEMNLVTNSGIAKKLEARSEELGESREQGAGSSYDRTLVASLPRPNFQFSTFNFQFIEPIVPGEKIEDALAQNDKKIHELTEKIKRCKVEKKSFDSDENMRNLREKLCDDSLRKVFDLYEFHCIDGKTRSLWEICEKYNRGKLPPTGTGDCCAPKLLNYAFSHGLKPISLAEIQYNSSSAENVPQGCGETRVDRENFSTAGRKILVATGCRSGRDSSPEVPKRSAGMSVSEGRIARPEGDRPTTYYLSPATYYLSPITYHLLIPPCDERCGILLPAMLGLRILYRDDAICVVDKESGILSVPGRGEDKQDCVESRFKRLFGDSVEIAQPAVHRLDMETSGVMILAFTREAHRELNRQFEAKEVQKEYVALLDGVLPKMGVASHGEMELFFRLDVENRPHQIWDAENGKSAVTEWQILGVERYHAPNGETRNATRVLFMPHTGRTHQLRLASADSHGFACPIIGDTLYGKCDEGERLMLHATKITFTHPTTGEQMTIESKAEF